jgi:hypothetical protein
MKNASANEGDSPIKDLELLLADDNLGNGDDIVNRLVFIK